MAKGLTKSKLAVLRSRSTGFVLIGVMGFLIAGFVFQPIIANIPNTLPQADPDQFEIPFVTPEQQENNEEIIKEIEEVIKDPEPNITIDPELIQQNEDCTQLIQNASQGNSQTTITEQQLTDCADVEQEIQTQTQEQTQEVIDTLEENIVVPDPVTFPTNSSSDSTLVQIGDIVIDNPIVSPILPHTTSLDLITKVTKIDSQANRVIVEKTTQFSRLAFLVEEQTNVDYRHGKLEIELYVKGEPDTRYTGTGTLDLKIGSSSIFVSPISISFDQTSDSTGKIPVNIISPSGAPSPLYTFDFNDNFSRFIDNTVNKISIVIDSLDATTVDENFSIRDAIVFTMDITRDDIQALITNADGGTSRIYPSDSRIMLSTVASSTTGSASYLSRVVTHDSLFLGNGRGCTQFAVTSDVTYPPSTATTSYAIPAPTVSGISVLDSQGNVIVTKSGGTGTVLDFQQLTRNQNYVLKVTSPAKTSSDLVYGRSQETKSFTCTQNATPKPLTQTLTQTGDFSNCGLYYDYYYMVPNGVTLGAVSCNIP